MNRTVVLAAAGLVLAAAGAWMFAQGAAIPAKAAVGQHLLERAWTRAAAGETMPRPWPWADMWPVARLEAPRLGKAAVILNETSGEAMAWGPGWMPVSAKPGAPGVAVFAAHRDTHFRFLKDLVPGDSVRVTTDAGRPLEYVVSHTEVVRWDASGIEPDLGPSRLALVTCYPFDTMTPGPLRYVVWSVPRQSSGSDAPVDAGSGATGL